ncbi:MAG TPA: tautomerase family protein [Solirubrobacteraceae bacterium]|jgi:phenylpyruvate tautomerase PptA (4-oxalocrotonate tautomerase family)|nr:tautomerase family protein [Solirubrobacteraceae bacterium]
MPAVQIDLLEGRTEDQLRAIGDAVHEAMVQTLAVPERDRFQIVTEHKPGRLDFNRSYLDIERSDGFVLVRVTLASGRSTETKQAFYARLSELLAKRAGMRTEDLTVMLSENEREDWSFGNGRASYAELPREAWR